MLKPLVGNVTSSKVINDPPPRACEACGTVKPGDQAINVMIGIGSPGHPSLKPFQCEQEEHWACSIECWAQVAKACVDEHMVQLLHLAHQSLK